MSMEGKLLFLWKVMMCFWRTGLWLKYSKNQESLCSQIAFQVS